MTENKINEGITPSSESPNVQLNMQYVKDFSFEAPSLPFALQDLKSAPEIEVSVNVNANKTDKPDLYTVDLSIRATALNKETGKTVFLCELVYGALVTAQIPNEHLQPFLLVEIPHLLFPFARTIVANMTREGGFPALQIAPVDFATLYRKKLEEQKGKETKN